jgi:hypothetical protein
MDDEKTEKRDLLIYELIAERFRLEWQRINDLDGKATNIIGFVGIIVSLHVGLGGFLLKEIPKTNEYYFYLYVLFLLGIIFLMCSILYALKAYYMKTWIAIPDTEILIEKYAKKDRSKIDIVRIVSQEISDAVKENKIKNDDKSVSIKDSFRFLVFGIGMNIIFVWGFLLI